jgi:hypothetical protein
MHSGDCGRANKYYYLSALPCAVFCSRPSELAVVDRAPAHWQELVVAQIVVERLLGADEFGAVEFDAPEHFGDHGVFVGECHDPPEGGLGDPFDTDGHDLGVEQVFGLDRDATSVDADPHVDVRIPSAVILGRVPRHGLDALELAPGDELLLVGRVVDGDLVRAAIGPGDDRAITTGHRHLHVVNVGVRGLADDALKQGVNALIGSYGHDDFSF